MQKRFIDKTVIVTGASSGIGAAAVRLFAAEGANVVLVARNAVALEKTVETLPPEHSMIFPVDVTDTDQLETLLQAAKNRFDSIDVVVNNAGFNDRGPVETKSIEALTRIIATDLTAPILFSRLALPYLRKAGNGAIVNVASLAGRLPLADEAAYSACKFALRVFSFALAEELSGSGITVSVVSPGPVDTGFIMEKIDDVPDIVFSQPMSPPASIAAQILTAADTGGREYVIPPASRLITTVGYLAPFLRRLLKPILERRGRKNKDNYRNIRRSVRG